MIAEGWNRGLGKASECQEDQKPASTAVRSVMLLCCCSAMTSSILPSPAYSGSWLLSRQQFPCLLSLYFGTLLFTNSLASLPGCKLYMPRILLYYSVSITSLSKRPASTWLAEWKQALSSLADLVLLHCKGRDRDYASTCRQEESAQGSKPSTN